jgi:hypothetical protein
VLDTRQLEYLMTGEEHFRKAEELAQEAHKLLGHGDGQATAAVWAAVAQVHATLALATATMLNPEGLQQALAAAFQLSSPAGDASYAPVAVRPSDLKA